jgi:hypothetical protein
MPFHRTGANPGDPCMVAAATAQGARLVDAPHYPGKQTSGGGAEGLLGAKSGSEQS